MPLPRSTGRHGLSNPIPRHERRARFRCRRDHHDRASPCPFVREFPFEVSLLSFLVADTGLIVETKDLHRRRPIRTEDRKYLHLEAFGVKPSAQVRISVQPLELRRPMAQWASAGFAVVAGLLAIGFLTVPLRGVSGEVHEPLPSHYSEERHAPYPDNHS